LSLVATADRWKELENIYSELLSRQVTEATRDGDGAVEDGAADEGAVEEAVNLGIPSQPSGTTLSFGWAHWTWGSKQGASFSRYSQWKYDELVISGEQS
jgi:hypothetical protein